MAQLDWQITADDRFLYRHEIDRLLVAFHPDWGEVTIGRQAIGLGRGVLFSAVDGFSPFSPVEVDREWRRGVDAVRLEYRLSGVSSAELIAVAGARWDDSALLARMRGYIGNLDGELIVGKRAGDVMCAGALSMAVKDAEVHLELAVFDTPESYPDGALFGDEHLVAKAVLGSSYTFDAGNGLTVLGEYHYNGFGVRDASDIAAHLLEPARQERYLRGELQTLGQHALGLQCAYPFSPTLNGSLMTLCDPTDGSGILSPSLVWDASQQTSVALSAFVPWGASPHNGQIRSTYGSSAASLFIQLSMYF